DPVARDVGPEICPGRHAHRLRRADVGHLDQRARSRIALAEQQEVVRLLFREHRQVGLDEVLAKARGDSRQLAAPDVLPDFPRVTRVDRHRGILPLFGPMAFPAGRPRPASRSGGGTGARYRWPRRVHTSGLTSTSGRSPRKTRSISPETCMAAWRVASRVTPATCEEHTTFCRLRIGLSADV